MKTETIQRLIYSTAITLDAENFKPFLALCSEDFHYSVVAYSPDLCMDMTWLNHDRKSMQDMLAMIPQHVRLKGCFKRHVSVYFVDPTADGQSASVVSSVLLIHTDSVGVSKVFAAGNYEDLVDLTGDTPLLKKRLVRLDTRDLSPGIHIPV